jgi:hypothetical protein
MYVFGPHQSTFCIYLLWNCEGWAMELSSRQDVWMCVCVCVCVCDK